MSEPSEGRREPDAQRRIRFFFDHIASNAYLAWIAALRRRFRAEES